MKLQRAATSGWMALVLVLAFGALPSFAAEWGTLKGRFVYDGKAPTPKKLAVNKDVQVCAKHHPLDESLVVGKDGGLANVVVYIRVPRGTKLPVHPDYDKTADAKVTLDNLHCRFDPHIALLRTSQKLVLKNSDSVGHNTKADFFVNQAFNVLIPASGEVEQQVFQGERLPVPVGCNIHPWMVGYLVVREDPYMAVSAKDGTFQIKNIPAGEHEFQLWQEKSGYVSGVLLDGKETKKGRVKLTISSGVLDLGEIKVDANIFEDK